MAAPINVYQFLHKANDTQIASANFKCTQKNERKQNRNKQVRYKHVSRVLKIYDTVRVADRDITGISVYTTISLPGNKYLHLKVCRIELFIFLLLQPAKRCNVIHVAFETATNSHEMLWEWSI